MSSKSRDKETYLKQYPETRKWLNECIICQSVGYKPELPEQIYPGLMAKHIRNFFRPLPVNELSICDNCAKYWNESKSK
jgi:hypothetical protein